MPFGYAPEVFEPLFVGVVVDWRNDVELKKAFAIALINAANAFDAACKIFNKETNKALFAAANWINDPVVIEAKQNYIEAGEQEPEKLLDKEQFCRTLLKFSTEKILYNGNEVYAAEAKDRLKALELYGKAQNFINDKTEINNNNIQQNRFMEIRFVEPEKKENVKIIDNSPIEQDEDILENSPIKLKLVG